MQATKSMAAQTLLPAVLHDGGDLPAADSELFH